MDLLFYPLVLAAVLLPVIWVGRRHTDHVETLAVAAGYGVLGAAAIGLARFFVALPASTPRLAGLLAFGLCVVAAVILWRVAASRHGDVAIQRSDTPARRSGAVQRIRVSLLLAVVSAALISVGIEASLPHYDLAERYYDWFVHFDLARVFHAATAADLGRHWGEATVTTRTPLYNLVGSLALSYLGDRLGCAAAPAAVARSSVVDVDRRTGCHPLVCLGDCAVRPARRRLRVSPRAIRQRLALGI